MTRRDHEGFHSPWEITLLLGRPLATLVGVEAASGQQPLVPAGSAGPSTGLGGNEGAECGGAWEDHDCGLKIEVNGKQLTAWVGRDWKELRMEGERKTERIMPESELRGQKGSIR